MADGQQRRDAQGRQRSGARFERQGHRSDTAPSERRRQGTTARQVAFEVLQSVSESDAYANLVLPSALQRARLTPRDAAFATEMTYGTLRMSGLYDAVIATKTSRPLDQIDPAVLDLLRLGTHQLLSMRVPSHAAVSETVGVARSHVGVGPAQFINAVLRSISEDTPEDLINQVTADRDDVEALAIRYSHPTWIVRALRDSLVAHGRDKTEIAALLEADNASPQVTLVARPGLSDADELLALIDESVPGSWAPTAVIMPGSDPAHIEAVRRGEAGVQDEGSQLVTLALLDTPIEGDDSRWLDMCAGPGGKAALMGAFAALRGATLVANESQQHRAELVDKSLRAVPDEAIERIQVWDGREIGDLEPQSYDRVLLDAPCTGLGALRRRPESRWRRTTSDVGQLSKLQEELLMSALKAVRIGGVVGYVTCSPHIGETRVVVDTVLRKLGGDTVEKINAAHRVQAIAGDTIDVGEGPDVQLWPHIHSTDAMHLTLLRRIS
ncbi:RsmB/NOP family class I SAM-dependent RNA methyltransferase [Jonesia quinghaiensis]|uniref:RsmB/NOP family class I SAM-dependent RNA methyltransferase n=1 Tax=Jonesia quinghaiensis TaxID=262806 RepID=UPI0003F88C2C|nr:transcription antitermination factor NusB [Jonesia quinghaiensis]